MGLKSRAFVSLLALMGLVTCCQKESRVEREINQTLAQLVEAEERQDAETLARHLAKEATFINLTSNETIEGQENLIAYLKEPFAPGEKPQVTVTTKSITIKSPANAIAKGKVVRAFSSGEQENLAFKAEFIRADERWLLQTWTEISLMPPPSQYENLKELEWLVGNWENDDEDSSFTSRNHWDKHKNFLLQRFKLKVLGQRQLYGKQIIGWDSREGKICSWVFDSDGGFGQSTWVQDDDNWIVSTRYTLANGSLASATYIYTKVDDNTYTFSSVGRDIDGDLLPNIGPFTMTKNR